MAKPPLKGGLRRSKDRKSSDLREGRARSAPRGLAVRESEDSATRDFAGRTPFQTDLRGVGAAWLQVR
jgi:hypothetical protein